MEHDQDILTPGFSSGISSDLSTWAVKLAQILANFTRRKIERFGREQLQDRGFILQNIGELGLSTTHSFVADLFQRLPEKLAERISSGPRMINVTPIKPELNEPFDIKAKELETIEEALKSLSKSQLRRLKDTVLRLYADQTIRLMRSSPEGTRILENLQAKPKSEIASFFRRQISDVSEYFGRLASQLGDARERIKIRRQNLSKGGWL